ncbi:hypothetical protein CLV62_10478 [Dysgonomonas alginatilytica]|uniref:Phage abortive infection protein n=1 Tax=Dysgonomonas alginatilytica TaxID=1605892 RepID=A0A2V3PTK3_9BACT|nr:hypothetical protein [Dysgonomonas alginatilytica]PXV66818.1 hypothetical protein CLV62_10478 [Dysgonomonas alginatilytica]
MKNYIFFILILFSIGAQANIDTVNHLKDTLKTTIGVENDSIITSTNTNGVIQEKNEKAENDNSNIFNILNVIIPIVTLFLGVGLDKIIGYFSNKKRITKVGNRWVAELYSLQGAFIPQIESLTSFKNQLTPEDSNIPNPILQIILRGSIFSSFDKYDLLEYIELKNKNIDWKQSVNISNQAVGYTTKISSIYETLIQNINEFKANSSLYTTSLSRDLQQFQRSMTVFAQDMEELTDMQSTELLRKVYELYRTHFAPHLEDSNFNPFDMENNFFKPLLEILSPHRKNMSVVALVNAITPCLNNIKAILLEKTYMRINLEHVIRIYEGLNEELPIIVEKVDFKSR